MPQRRESRHGTDSRFVHLAVYTLHLNSYDVSVSTLSTEHHDRQIARFERAGFLFPLRYAIQTGTATEWDHRYDLFPKPFLAHKVKGGNRTTHVLAQIQGVIERFAPIGMQGHIIKTGRTGYPEQLLIQWEDCLFLVQQLAGNNPNRALEHANYRAALMRRSTEMPTLWTPEGPEPLRTPLQELEFWSLTYQRTPKRLPDWITLGRPLQGQKTLHYACNLLEATAHYPQLEQAIDLNPQTTLPQFPVDFPGTNTKPEGEGE